jgi:hypothetical protein
LVPDGRCSRHDLDVFDTRSGQVNVLQMKHNLSQVADKLERVDKLLDDVMLFLESMNLKEDDANFNDWSDLMERLIRV